MFAVLSDVQRTIVPLSVTLHGSSGHPLSIGFVLARRVGSLLAQMSDKKQPTLLNSLKRQQQDNMKQSPPQKVKSDAAGVGSVLSSDESRYETCPVCSKSISKAWIESHVATHFETSESRSSGQHDRPFEIADSPERASDAPISPSSDVTGRPPPQRQPPIEQRKTTGGVPASAAAAVTSVNVNSALKPRRSAQTPLAERMRPRHIDEMIGHADIVGPRTLLRSLLDADQVRQGGSLRCGLFLVSNLFDFVLDEPCLVSLLYCVHCLICCVCGCG